MDPIVPEMKEWWEIGIALSLTASFFGTVGKVLMKLSHSNEENLPMFVAATVCVVLLNPCFDAMSYAYASQTILAPMAGFSVVWNIVLSPCILKEKVVQTDVIGTVVILAGCIMVGLSGSHQTPHNTMEELFALFQERLFLVYAVIVLLASVLLVWVILTFPRRSEWRRLAFGVLSGLVGGNLFFLKAAVELVTGGSYVWYHVETYLIIACALGSAGGGIFILNQGLKDYDAIYLVAVYQTALIIIGSLSGIVFFHENDGMHTVWQQVLYPVSIFSTVLGIYILSKRKEEDHEVLIADPLKLVDSKSYGSV